jgi:hypothetical protein
MLQHKDGKQNLLFRRVKMDHALKNEKVTLVLQTGLKKKEEEEE